MSAGAFRHFDGMCWPAPGEYLSDTAHALAWNDAPSEEMKRRMLVASSVIAAYAQLILLPERERNRIIKELRKGPTPPKTASSNPPASREKP